MAVHWRTCHHWRSLGPPPRYQWRSLGHHAWGYGGWGHRATIANHGHGRPTPNRLLGRGGLRLLLRTNSVVTPAVLIRAVDDRVSLVAALLGFNLRGGGGCFGLRRCSHGCKLELSYLKSFAAHRPDSRGNIVERALSLDAHVHYQTTHCSMARKRILASRLHDSRP